MHKDREEQGKNITKDPENSPLYKEFRDLKRRIKATRHSRIEASKRLRRKNSYYEKITNFYSLIVLILSVWFLNQSGEMGLLAAKILLVLSLSLTYFTMFINAKNYKERAGNFETNYQQLDVLTNKLDRFEASQEVLTENKLKEFQREYEKLIIGKENHLNIDFYMSTPEKQKEFKEEIIKYKIAEGLFNTLIAIYPILLLLLIYLFSKLIKIIKF
ncbi:SLATT domain-containing protein [Anoxybacillus sp. ST4]|uniref:SLATT domain-containing protein n=1 Tax=Anoxybacillus sp. ST4 TaxID=2864181 RepID=UPI001C641C4F|nr:SLATT domain-containing protein [Anoxybacillus sp. ST4]MBW7649919.1 SLATT domain-containing protein [Anoxybacillus sp. ST4]